MAIIALLLTIVDLGSLRQQLERFDWRLAPAFAGLIVVLLVVFGFRWHLLLSRRLPASRAFHHTCVGLGGNMVLPARGGDVLRIVYAARTPGIGAHVAVSTLFLEKMIDLMSVAAIGLAAFALEAGTATGTAARATAVATAALVLGAGTVILALARAGRLTPLIRATFRWVRLGPSLYRHAYAPLRQLRRAASIRALAAPLLLTFFLWAALYPGTYALIGQMVAVPLSYRESAILVFAGALGLALPAAPSGLGTFHASIVSGFVLLGRDPSEGLALAVAIHAAFFIGLVVPGAVVYALRPLGASRPSRSGVQ
jgi:uncharacterized membrane protein YbhN (UPF0104 family)